MIKKQSIFYVMAVVVAFTSCTKKEPKELPRVERFEMAEWARPAQEGGTTAAYFSYTNNLAVADTLLSVQSPVSDLAQVHESYKTDDGMMGMREAEIIQVKAGETISFLPGSFHIMLMQLNKTLAKGDSILVEMEWSQKGIVKKELPVITQ